MVNGGCDSIKYWDADLLIFESKAKVIGKGKEVSIDSQYK